MQEWEYKYMRRNRTLDDQEKGGYKFTDWNVNIEDMLPKLGGEGWELVTVSASSTGFGMKSGTEELWVFKRPKAIG